MIKKLSKLFAFVLVGVVLLTGTVQAASRPSFSFTLKNSGRAYPYVTDNYNKKTVKSDPWSIKVNTITCKGKYGISFCPVQYDLSIKKNIKWCTQSSCWRNTVGWSSTVYAAGDVKLMNYKLSARQDDSYTSSFKATGWFNADKVQ